MYLTHIIFDFDGTLVDSEEILLQSIHALKVPQLLSLKKEDIQRLKKLGLREAVLELKIPLYRLPSLVLRAQQEMKSRRAKIFLFHGIQELLFKLHRKGFVLGILTSNSVDIVDAVLNQHDVRSLFRFVHNEKDLFGKNKSLAHLIKKYSLAKEETLYIGDEVRDFEACQKIGIEMIGVGWGYNSSKVLREHGLKTIAKTPEEILKYIQ